MMEGHVTEKLFGKKMGAIVRLTFGRGRIVSGPVNSPCYDDTW